MACGEPSVRDSKQMQLIMCQLCGRDMVGSCFQNNLVPNYQKQVDPPAMPYDIELSTKIRPDPISYRFSTDIPLITHTPTIEYRVTGEVRGKPANYPGVLYIMNHGAMEKEDVMQWVNKKKYMSSKNLPWVGDGTYVETRPQMLHFFGNTTHLFTKNPDNPYQSSGPSAPPVCRPRNGLDYPS